MCYFSIFRQRPVLFTVAIPADSVSHYERDGDAGTPKTSTTEDAEGSFPLQESGQNGGNDSLVMYMLGLLMCSGGR